MTTQHAPARRQAVQQYTAHTTRSQGRQPPREPRQRPPHLLDGLGGVHGGGKPFEHGSRGMGVELLQARNKGRAKEPAGEGPVGGGELLARGQRGRRALLDEGKVEAAKPLIPVEVAGMAGGLERYAQRVARRRAVGRRLLGHGGGSGGGGRRRQYGALGRGVCGEHAAAQHQPRQLPGDHTMHGR